MRDTLFLGLMVWTSLLLSPGARAAEPKKAKAPTFQLPALGELPKAEGLSRKEEAPSSKLATPTVATYEVVSVKHARAFAHSGAGGSSPIAEIDAVTASGNPPTSEKFSTAIRVRCPQQVGAAIDVVILDPRSDTVMTSSGQLSYRGSSATEVEYTIDWAPTPLRAGGEYKVLVRVAGQPLGTWPLQVVAKP